ncbi:unnamed protein product [Candida verbasci]|uniref:Uncharacterized protein n=1 Tax=Candida verbasci TaxID=1227364 RepID=A0A9W4XGS5_9ASCO|nr:unnamed protein product [Candida verbasci]
MRSLSIQSCSQLPNARRPQFIKSNNLYNLIWNSPLKNVFIVKKPKDLNVKNAMIEFINYLGQDYPSVNIIINEDVVEELGELNYTVYTGSSQDIVDKTDMLITLGGDGTILHGVSLFSNSSVPPVLSFAMGTLGFLLPFDFKNFKQCFSMVYENRSKALHRNRLECHVYREKKTENREMIHAMNEITIHRGSLPNLTALDIYIDNEFFTTTNSDGIIFSTPTGSTAYSLSSGGSITHPNVPCILLTPICPRSLSFRPLILPSASDIMIKLSDNNRNKNIELIIDGISQNDLQPGDELHITSESIGNDDLNGIWCVATDRNQWAKDINSLLGFNNSFKNKGKI